MLRHKLLRTRRHQKHNYSAPAFYHLLLESEGKAGIFATERNEIYTLSELGCSFLDTFGQALHNFPCVHIHAMTMRPSAVELLVEVTEWRNQQAEPEYGTAEWIQWRRTMTLPVFVGYLKTNSGMQINAETKGTGAVWSRRYRERVVGENERAALQMELRNEWQQVLIPTVAKSQKQKKRPYSFAAALYDEFRDEEDMRIDTAFSNISFVGGNSTMVPGRILLLTGIRRTVTSSVGGSAESAGNGGRLGQNGRVAAKIRSLGPGRLFLSG